MPGTRYVSVRKRGTRKDGRNYVTTCHICPGARGDVSGVGGVSREEAVRLSDRHIGEVHGGRRTI
jgi:hypothetical protein